MTAGPPPPGQVTWAPTPGMPHGGTWPQPDVRAFPPDAGLRALAGGLALVAGGLVAASTFLDLIEGGMTTLSGWGSTGDGPMPERELLLGIPLVLAAVALVVAGVLVLVSLRRPALRPAAGSATVAAVALSTAVAWIVTSYVDRVSDGYRRLDVEGLTADAGVGHSVLLAGSLAAVVALLCLLVAGLLHRPEGRRAAATQPAAAAPQPWPGEAPPHGVLGPSPWERTR